MLTYKFVLIVLIGLFFAAQLPFLTSVPRVWTDEPWYANVAYNFAEGNGLVDTIARDASPWPTFLYPLIMGLFFKLFGTTVWVGRFVSLLAGALALTGLFQILKLWKGKPWAILVTGIYFIVSNVYFVVFRTIRPEAWCVAFGVWAFYFISKGIIQKPNRNFLLSALLTSFAVFCHPNGSLYAVLYGLFVFGYSCRQKKFLPIAGFGVVGLLCVTGWLFYYAILSGADVGSFLESASESRTVANEESVLTAFFGAVRTFAATYSLGLKRIYIFVFEVGVLIIGLLFVKRDQRLFFTSLGGLLFFLTALALFQPLSTRHFGEVLFFVLLAMALLMEQPDWPKWMRAGVITAITLYGLNNLAGTAYFTYLNHNNTPFDEIAAQIKQQIPKGSNVVSFLPFWFGLQETEFYNVSTRWTQKGYESMDEFLESGDVDYILLTPYLLEGITGTAGRQEYGPQTVRISEYYNKAASHVEAYGSAIWSLNTSGYGQIVLWKLD